MNLSKIFNKLINPTEFERYLTFRFGYLSMLSITSDLKKLDIDPPIKSDQFFKGYEGAMIFMQDYGVTVKIEKEIGSFGSRVVHENIIQPIFQKKSGTAVIDILPGSHLDLVEEDDLDDLCDRLDKDGIDFYDSGVRNMGYLPIVDTENPQGIAIVIDALSVRDLTETSMESESLLPFSVTQKHRLKRAKTYQNSPQEKLYRPLKKAFSTAYDNKENCKKAWELCSQFLSDGKLINGWNELREKDPKLSEEHPDDVVTASKNYANMLECKRN